MRRTSLLAALVLVFLAGTLPVLAGIARAFRADSVVLLSGAEVRGDATEEGGTVRVRTGEGIREFPRAEVKEVRRGAVLTLLHARRALGDPASWRVLGWTTAIALLGTLGAVLLGVPYAVFTARTDLPGRRLLAVLYAAPLVLPPLLLAMAWDNVLPQSWREGPAGLGRWGTALHAAALFSVAYFPLVTLFTRRSLAAVGAAQEEAAILAAGPWRAFRRVTLPLAAPGILMGALFAFVFCLNDFSVVDFLNVTRTGARRIETYPFLIQFNFSRLQGSIEDLLVLGIPVALLSVAALGEALRRGARASAATVGSTWRPPRPLPLGPAGRLAGWALCGGVLLCAVAVPALELAAESGGAAAYARVFGQGGAGEALRFTLGLSLAAAVLAIPAALVLAEAGRRLGRGTEALVASMAMLPLALVPALVPLGAREVWDRAPFAMTRGDAPWNPVLDTPILAALVIFARVLPFALAATWASLREVEPSLLEAAEAAGVPWDVRLRRIAVPLARPGIALGGLLAFVFAVRELDAVALLKLPTKTLLQKLWDSLHFMRDETVAAMAVVLLAVLAFAFGAAALTGWLRPRAEER
jgi:iron(III) transport system permease protein